MSEVIELPHATDRGAGKQTSGPATHLQEILAARILRLLKSKNISPGHQVNVANLSRHFQVSQTPVRAALKLLETNGMTYWRAGRGFVLDRPIADAWSVIPGSVGNRQSAYAVVAARSAGSLARICSTQDVAEAIGEEPWSARAAMDELQRLGLVQRRSGARWWFCDDKTFSSVLGESYGFRLALETWALTQINTRQATQFLTVMKARHLALLRRDSDVASDFRALNQAFHDGLMQLSGNKFALTAVHQHLEISDIIVTRADPAAVHASIREHLEVIEALQDGAAMLAAHMMHEHLMAARRRRNCAVPERHCHG